jgi:hypothetical protein
MGLNQALELQVNAPFDFEWAEVHGPGYTLQQDSTTATLVYETYWRDFVDPTKVVPQILGYPRRFPVLLNFFPWAPGQAQTGGISRIPPFKHPYMPWLYATSITNVEGRKGLGWEKPKHAKVAKYERARFTVTFSTLPYNVLTDDEAWTLYNPAQAESERYVIKTRKSTPEAIAINPGFYKYVEGNPAPGPLNGKVLLGLSRMMIKSDMEWIWVNVPEQSIFADDGSMPLLDSVIGTVNSDAIWGFPAETLLMLSIELKPRMLPISPSVLGIPANKPQIPRVWDVHFHFKYWNPPLGAGAVTKGWNAAIFVNDSLFYRIASDPAGRPLYGVSDFKTAFWSL